MIQPTYTSIETMIKSPVRQIKARAELLNGSALLDTFTYEDRLISFTVDRVGDSSKFFGFGICQKLNIKLIDKARELDITTANELDIAFGTNSDYMYVLPRFKVSEVNRDETTNQLSITAYDAIYEAANHTISEIPLTNYNIRELVNKCASIIGLPVKIINCGTAFEINYPNGGNFEGTENLRAVLDACAEATQSFYFINNEGYLTFKRLDIKNASLYTIGKEEYFNLTSKTNRRLKGICSATELGDNVIAELDVSGTIQYVRDNPMWEMREDMGTLIQAALRNLTGLVINQFECSWRGNFLIELGDKIDLITKDNDIATTYLLDDVISYDGSYSQKSKWEYSNKETAETAANPATLGEALKQTFARVDKQNREIQLVASKTEENAENISSLIMDTDSISASVKSIEENTADALATVNGDIEEIEKSVSAKMTSEEVAIEISTALSNGVSKVETSTGFTFNDEGLTVSKSDSEMKTLITEDGMTVYKDNEAVLTANNIGVDAVNLRATTYLIIGTNSRFEDYGTNRTGCFFIGN